MNKYTYSWAAIWETLAGDAGGVKWRQLMGQYMRGNISYHDWCNIAAKEFASKGILARDIIALAKEFSLVDNCTSVLRKLKSEGYKLAIVFGGIGVFSPQVDWMSLCSITFISINLDLT